MKRISFKQLGILLGLLLIIGVITPLSVLAADYTPSLTQNTDGVYEIGTLADLESFRTDLAAAGSTGYRDETVVLTADIEIGEEKNFTDIDQNFYGTFDGQGHKITLNNQEIIQKRSIIPRNYGIIKNLTVLVNDGTTKTESTAARSPLCDANYGRIEYVKVEGNIKISAANEKAITVAGIAGSNATKDISIIENTISSIDYTLDGTPEEIEAYQGRKQGVLLYQFYASGNGDLNKCYSLGKVTNSDFAKTTATGGKVAIGLAVYSSGTGQGVSYYNSENLTPAVVFGSEVAYKDTPEKVIGKTMTELQNQETYEGWDFKYIWTIDGTNDNLPYLNIRITEKRLQVKPVFEEKTWNDGSDGSDLSAEVTGMEFSGLSEAEKTLLETYKVTINFDPKTDVTSAAFKSMQNMGWRDVTVVYKNQPTITVGELDQATEDGYRFELSKVVTGQARIVDNKTPGPDENEQKAQIAKAKEANTIIFEKYIGDGSTYLTPLTVVGDLPGDKIFLQDLWAIFSAARGDYVPGEDSAFYDKWFANVKTSLHTLKEGGLKPEDMKVTEWTKLVMAITAAGYDARDIEDYDLIDIISDKNMLDNNKVLQEQTAYLALLGGGYEMTAKDPLVADISTIGTSGAASLNTYPDTAVSNGDNAMFFQQLGFFLDDPVVKAATDNYMYNRVGGDNPILQNGDGSFTTTGQPLNAYNNAQTMIALGCFNMNVFDNRFIQNGNTVLDSQFNFIDFDNRTYQGTYEITQLTRGFTAVIRQYEGRNQIFDTSDIVGATKPVNDLLIALTNESNEADIAAAKAAYEKLSEVKKASLKKENLAKIIVSNDDQAAAKTVTDQIAALGIITLEKEKDVIDTKAAYDKLTTAQKALVTAESLKILTDAEAKIAELKAAAGTEADKAAAQKVSDLIAEIKVADQLKAGDKAEVMKSRKAFKALTDIQKALVSEEAQQKLIDAEAKIAELEKKVGPVKSETGKIEVVGLPEKVKELKVEDKKDDPDVTAAAKKAAEEAKIAEVEVVILYGIKPDMTETELENFNNDADSYVTMTLVIPEDKRGAESYRIYHKKTNGDIEWIDPTLSEDGSSLIFKVSSFSDFGVMAKTEATGETEDEKAAKTVVDQIAALPAVEDLELTNKTEVTAARSAYTALTEIQKGLVTNLATLTAAEEKIAELEKNETDKAAAKKVTDQINALGTITKWEQKASIESARTEYNKLTSDQKALVSSDTLKILTNAETAIEKLKPNNGSITIDVERFTIGQGFYVEPVSVSIKEGETARQALEELLGADNLVGDPGYLRAVKGADTGKATIPDYIVSKIGGANSATANAYPQKYSGTTLGEFDYSKYSGWYYLVNNSAPNVGMNEYKLKNGDVMRLAFTYWGTGSDITGIEFGSNKTLVNIANKDSLLKAIAAVNANKSTYLSDADIKTAYDTAMTVAQDMTATLKATNDAATALNEAVADSAGIDKTAAKTVTDKIAALPAVSKLALTDKAAITAARTAYDGLTATQKTLVTNLNTLTAAEAKIAELEKEATEAANKAAAKAVVDKIAALPSGTALLLGEKADVVTARIAYNALTETQKALVTNLNTLILAETRIAELEAETPVVKDKKTGIEAIGLPKGTTLKVGNESADADKTDEALKSAKKEGIKDAKIIALYTIKPDMSDADLAKFNNDATSYVTLTIPLNTEQQGYDRYQIYHKKTDGTVEWITPTLSEDGKSLIFKVNAFSDFGLVGTKTTTDTEIPVVDVSYCTHVQNVGWQDWRNNGDMSGTQGKSLRLEGIQIKRTDKADVDLGIRYETHIENIGWEDDWKADGDTSGTEGRSLRLEAIRIELTGADAKNYDVYYQVHAQNIGWMGFAQNGKEAGTAGFGYRLEGIRVVVVPKGQAAPTPEDGSIETAFLIRR